MVVYSNYELNRLISKLAKMPGIEIVYKLPNPCSSLLELNVAVRLDSLHCETKLVLSFDGSLLNVQFASVPTSEGLRLLFNQVVQSVRDAIAACFDMSPVKTNFVVYEIPCVKGWRAIPAMIIQALGEQGLVRVQRKCNILSSTELEFERTVYVNVNFIDTRLLNNVELMTSLEWKDIFFIQKTEQNLLKLYIWRVIKKSVITETRPSEVLAKVMDSVCEEGQRYMTSDVGMYSCAVSKNIAAAACITKYEVKAFANDLPAKLEAMGFAVSMCSEQPRRNDDVLSQEEADALQRDVHYNYQLHVQSEETALSVWAITSLTDEGKALVCRKRHDMALANHLSFPMTTDTANVEKNQRVYMNVGYRGDPVPADVGVNDTCLCVEKVKQDKKLFYRFRYVLPVIASNGREFLKTFLVPVNAGMGKAPYISTEPIDRGHHVHAVGRRRLHYSTMGRAAFGMD